MIQHEQIFYQRVRKILIAINDLNSTKGGLKFSRIESHMKPGIPDITYSFDGKRGWIELKSAGCDGKSYDFDHYTIEQHEFLTAHGSTAGSCFLLVELRGRVADKKKFPIGGFADSVNLVALIPWSNLFEFFDHKKKITYARLEKMADFVEARDADIMYSLSRYLKT